MNKKIVVIVVVIAFVLSLVYLNRPVVLKIGVFAGSNWNVPSGDSYKIIDYAIEEFEKKNPHIQLEYESGILKEDYSEWLAESFLQGEEPDVFMVLSEDFNILSSLGALQDLNQYIEADSSFQTSDFYESSLQAGVYQNQQYALPYESNPTLMFVNKTLLKKENIDTPDNDWTLDDFYEICQKVTKDSNGDGIIDQYGCYNFDWLDSFYSYGANLFDEEGKKCYLTDKEMKESILFNRKLNEINQGYEVTSEQFDNGHVVFSPMPFSQYRTYKPYPWRVKKYSNFEWDCVRMPSLSTVKKNTEVSSLLMGISSRSNFSQESWEFLKFLTYNHDIQKKLFEYSQGISSLKAVTQSPDSLKLLNDHDQQESLVDMSLLNEVMNNSVAHSQFKKYESALNLIDTRMKDIIDSDQDIDLALMTLQKEINQYLNE